MKNRIVLISVILSVFIMAPLARPQGRGQFGGPFYYDKSSAYLLIGYIQGPSFEDYIDWANEAYGALGATQTLDDFGGAIAVSIGLRSRFSRYFALEVDFLTSAKKTEVTYITNDGLVPQQLDLTIGAISFSLPIIFHFSNKQPVVPFVAAGATVFPLRLDHAVTWNIRHTKTAMAGNFAFGLESEIVTRWWLTARVDWTFGKANMPVTETYLPLSDDKYEIDLSTTQFQIGVLRGLY